MERPTTQEFKKEYSRLRKKQEFHQGLGRVIRILVVVAAISIIIATVFFSIMQVRGSSMSPTMEENEIIIVNRYSDVKKGDLIAFYYNNKVLLKRVIGISGDMVDMDDEGNVYVNNEKIEEEYLEEKDYGTPDITFPYQVPDGRYFVMGDHRSVSIDSRYQIIGTVSSEQLIGKVKFRIWPITRFGPVK